MAWNERYELSDITFEFSKDLDPSIDPFQRLKDIQGNNPFARLLGQCSTIDDFLQKKGVKVDREPGGIRDNPKGRFERV